jgi:hypothetical protein
MARSPGLALSLDVSETRCVGLRVPRVLEPGGQVEGGGQERSGTCTGRGLRTPLDQAA